VADARRPGGPVLPASDLFYPWSRVALGVVGLAAPGMVGRAFGIGNTPLAQVASRHIAARDLVAGVGMVLGRRHGRARGWYEAAALTDAIDAGIAAIAGATGKLPRKRALLVTLVAGGSAVSGLVAARQLPELGGGSRPS
jgi:hypothetical protein